MKAKGIIFLSLFLVIASMSIAAEASDVGPVDIINHGLDAGLAAEIENYVAETMAEKHCPGIAVGIVRGDELVYQGYFGWAEIKGKTPVSETTVFRIGSISKTFTAVGLMQQYEQGRFKLDTEFNSVMPYPVIESREPGCGPVTFKHMFTHTSGGGELMSYRSLWKPSQTLALPKGAERPSLEEAYRIGIRTGVCPDVKWCYCNFCYGALGFSLEELSGMSFQDYTEERVLDPIGMELSTFYENEEILSNLAQGYSWDPLLKKFSEAGFWRIPIVPMGNMFSTVPEMGEYLKALLHGGANSHGRLVKPETLEFMFKTQYTVDERIGSMGITFAKGSTLLGTRVLGHGGAVPGFGSSMYFAPDKGVGVIVFGNVMSEPPYRIGYWLILRLIGYEKPSDFPEPDPSKWAGLEGYYGSSDPEFLSDARFLMGTLGAVRVKASGDKLVTTTLRLKKKALLRQVFEDDHMFFMVENPEDPDAPTPSFVSFVPGDDGRAKALRIGMNEYVRLEGAALARAMLKASLLAWIPASF